MTNDPDPAFQMPPTSEVERRYDESGAVLFLIAAVLGVLRAVVVVATGSGGFTPWVEALYAVFFHIGAGFVVSTTVRALGIWLGREIPPSTGSLPPASPVAPLEPPPSLDPGIWRARIDAAREAGDPIGVLELREQAPDGLDETALKDLDAGLAKWLLTLVHQRLRSGPLQPDLVTLVGRASEAFGHTKEGASLRAALPTLRRGAGLCPRCAKPYTGVWEACAECMGRPEPPPPVIPGLVAVEDEGYESPAEGERWFLDPDDRAGA